MRRPPSERVLTVWGNFADFIMAVKVMISVRSSRLQPVQSPFIRRIKCFCRGRNRTVVRSSVDFRPLNWTSPVQFELPTCETAHASSGFSNRISENSIKTLQPAATESSWFLGTKERKHTDILKKLIWEYHFWLLPGRIRTLTTYCGDVVRRKRHKRRVERLVLFVMMKNVRFTVDNKKEHLSKSCQKHNKKNQTFRDCWTW